MIFILTLIRFLLLKKKKMIFFQTFINEHGEELVKSACEVKRKPQLIVNLLIQECKIQIIHFLTTGKINMKICYKMK